MRPSRAPSRDAAGAGGAAGSCQAVGPPGAAPSPAARSRRPEQRGHSRLAWNPGPPGHGTATRSSGHRPGPPAARSDQPIGQRPPGGLGELRQNSPVRSRGTVALTSVMISPGMYAASLASRPDRRPGGHGPACQPAATHGDPLCGAGSGWGCGLAFPGPDKRPAAAAPRQPAWSCPAHRGGPPAAGQQRPAVRPGLAGVVLDIGQALGESAISDPHDVHAADVPVSPVVAPAHDGACRAVGELLLDIESGLRRLREQLPPDPRTASRPWWRTPSGGGEVDSNTTSSVTRARTASRSWALRGR